MAEDQRGKYKMAKQTQKSTSFDFEATLVELNQIVEQMEHGDLTLEDSLKKFERGVGLARTCQAALKTAEQKVQILTQQNNQATLLDFAGDVDSER